MYVWCISLYRPLHQATISLSVLKDSLISKDDTSARVGRWNNLYSKRCGHVWSDIFLLFCLCLFFAGLWYCCDLYLYISCNLTFMFLFLFLSQKVVVHLFLSFLSSLMFFLLFCFSLTILLQSCAPVSCVI